MFVGVDGGGTQSTIRLEDAFGHLVAEKSGGPANIRLSVEGAWHSIETALNELLKPLGLSSETQLYVGMGLAGSEVQEAYHAFLNKPHDFYQLVLTSDAHIACLGAHGGKNGSIIVIGTGVVGYQIENDQHTKIGGWGFPHDDEGGGAWLGLQAIKAVLRVIDGRAKPSLLTESILRHFESNPAKLILWTNAVNATGFASLAPLIIEAAHQKDPLAIQLLQKAALFIDEIALSLIEQQSVQALQCTLIGGLAPFVSPFLCEEVQARLKAPEMSPAQGAILLMKKELG